MTLCGITHTHTHTYTHICTHMHAHTHTHTHTHTHRVRDRDRDRERQREREKDHLCFCKYSTSQVFTFICNKVVYFKKHLAFKVQHLQQTKFSLPLDVSYCCETIKLAVVAIVELLYT